MASSHTLYFDSGDEVTGCTCHTLSHFGFTIKGLALDGTRHSIAHAVKVLRARNTNGKPTGKIYFHPGGHKFRGCDCGYRREETANGISLQSMDSRLCWKPGDFWLAINREPFETPMVIEWSDLIYQACAGVYVKPMTGLNSTGEYLDPTLTPTKLDILIKAMVKRRVLPF